MKKQILFIQGAGTGSYRMDKKLADNLQHLLGTSYVVHYPEMHNEEDADYETWARQIVDLLKAQDGSIFLVGHSVGGSVLMKFLTEKDYKKSVAGVFIIAAPFWGGDKGWKYDGYETLALPTTTLKIADDVPVFFYHSRDDETVPFEHLELYGNSFSNASIRKIDSGGHQLNSDLSVVANDLKKL
ncbi:alpha/beta fold hydrolase [Pseudochryseolinea flava]|nr:alpha/beta fold hydrolase [Pseudochryseolinea flava]